MQNRHNKSAKKLTLRDIARALGLSKGTVSRAMNNDPLIRASTREKVQHFSRKKGYVPDHYARIMRTQKSMRLGIILPTLDNPFYVEKVAYAQEAAWQAGYELNFVSSEWNLEREISCCKRLLSMRVAGVIIDSRADEEFQDHFNNLVDQGIPIIDLTGKKVAGPGISSITVNRAWGMEQAVRHLLKLGHRSLCLVGCKPYNQTLPFHEMRWEGVLTALNKHNLGKECLEVIPTVDQSRGAGYSAVGCLIRRGLGLPTGILALNDEVACGAMAALYDHRISVPDQVSVVGFDNTLTSRFIRPALTTVSQTHLQMGRRAVEMLLKRIENPLEPEEHITLEPKLVVRASTALYTFSQRV